MAQHYAHFNVDADSRYDTFINLQYFLFSIAALHKQDNKGQSYHNHASKDLE